MNKMLRGALTQLLTPEQLAKLQTAPTLVLTVAEVDPEIFPEPDVGVAVEYKNEHGVAVDIEELSPGFESESAAAVYLDMLALQILEMKKHLHLYFAQHAAPDTGEADALRVGHNGPHALSSDNPHMHRRSGTGETIT
jgi:hypothetical protein